MGVREKALGKLNALGQHLRDAMERGDRAALAGLCREVEETRAWYGEELPRQRRDAYAEVYDGLLRLLRRMAEDKTPGEELFLLCGELLRGLAKETEGEKQFKKELVFLPYQSSMWDSMESIWRAADRDRKRCHAYVVPIPWAGRNPDRSAGAWHSDREKFPPDVPTLDWREVDLKAWHPDAIFIHYPYDNENLVTTLDARYFSHNLKPHTGLLVYSPYYVTSGCMGEGQALCPAYPFVDYIIVQSEKVCRQFHPSVPKEKLLPLGSPKLDRVIRINREKPEPPAGWKERMRGKKVYFYNTSLNGLLQDTEQYLEKMRYVFRTFAEQGDACLLWRPHPLLDATFGSMREQYREAYESLKREFLGQPWGIYDDTPEIETAIAWSDVYLGDTGTSVTALFGITGKPLFILNNALSSPPEGEDWRGGAVGFFHPEGKDWMVIQGSRLYHAPGHDFRYRFYCDLPGYAVESYYGGAVEVEGRTYVYPLHAQELLLVGEGGIERRIPLERGTERPGAFYGCIRVDEYLFLLPNQYPDLVRYDTRRDRVDYLRGFRDSVVQELQGERLVGGFALRKGHLLVGAAASPRVLDIDPRTLETREVTVGREGDYGCQFILPDGEDVWLLPQAGDLIRRWNPETGDVREYGGLPEGFSCRHFPMGVPCMVHPFTSAACSGEYLYLAPCWGNMFLRLHKESGRIEEWKTSIPPGYEKSRNGYFLASITGVFTSNPAGETFFFHAPGRRWYRFDAEGETFAELPVAFDREEVLRHTPGFAEWSEWFPYGCQENAFQTLGGLLEGTLPGAPHDRARQMRAFGEMAENADGSCGEKVYRFTMEELERRGK